jgi:hypothetical protein
MRPLFAKGDLMKKLLVPAAFGLASLAMAASIAQAEPAKKSPAKKGLLIMYSGAKFQGESLEIKKARTSITDEMPVGSFAVFPGDSWEICEGPRYKAPCRIVKDSETGLGGIMIRSVRPAPAAPKPPTP